MSPCQDDTFQDILSNLPNSVTLISIFDSCFGGGFTGGANDQAETDRIKIIGPSATCPIDPPSIFGAFLDTITEDTAEIANQGRIVTGTDLKNYLIGEGWSLGPSSTITKPKSQKSKSEDTRDLPSIEELECERSSCMISGSNFAQNSDLLIELFTSDQQRITIGSGQANDTGSFNISILLPSTLTNSYLISVTDSSGNNDWDIKSVPEPTSTLGLLVVSFLGAGSALLCKNKNQEE